MDRKTSLIGMLLFLVGLLFTMAGCGEEEMSLDAQSKKKERESAPTEDTILNVDYFLSLCGEGMPESNKDEFRLAYSRATEDLYECAESDGNHYPICVTAFQRNLEQNLETCNFFYDPTNEAFLTPIQNDIVEVIEGKRIALL